jgi:hypothetical protein
MSQESQIITRRDALRAGLIAVPSIALVGCGTNGFLTTRGATTNTIDIGSRNRVKRIGGFSHDEAMVDRIAYNGIELEPGKTFSVQLSQNTWSGPVRLETMIDREQVPGVALPFAYTPFNDQHERIVEGLGGKSDSSTISPHDRIYALINLQADTSGNLVVNHTGEEPIKIRTHFSGEPVAYRTEGTNPEVARTRFVDAIKEDFAQATFNGQPFYAFPSTVIPFGGLGKTYVRDNDVDGLQIDIDRTPGANGWDVLEATVRSLNGHAYALVPAKITNMPADWLKPREQKGHRAEGYSPSD